MLFCRKFFIGIVACLLTATTTTGARAQAWTQKKGGYYFKVAASLFNTDAEFDSNGNRRYIGATDTLRTDVTFRDVALTAYLEYGMTDFFTLIAKLPFKILTTEELATKNPVIGPQEFSLTNGGLADLLVMVRAPSPLRYVSPLYYLFKSVAPNSASFSMQGGPKVPLGYEKEPDNEGPPLGSGELDLEIHDCGGISLYPVPAYLSWGVGYRWRGGDQFHDEIPFNFEGGYTAGDWFFKLRFDGLLNEVKPAAAAADNPNLGDRNEFKLSPEITYQVREGFSVSAEAFHVFAGKNTADGTTFSVGLVYSR